MERSCVDGDDGSSLRDFSDCRKRVQSDAEVRGFSQTAHIKGCNYGAGKESSSPPCRVSVWQVSFSPHWNRFCDTSLLMLFSCRDSREKRRYAEPFQQRSHRHFSRGQRTFQRWFVWEISIWEKSWAGCSVVACFLNTDDNKWRHIC